MKISNVVSMGLNLSYLLFTLFALWLTLDWQVRRTRRAFEKQLIRQGMAKKDAKRLSFQYSKMKDDIMNTLKRSIIRIP
jgi:hypothetical protein